MEGEAVFFACEECRGECRGHAYEEPLQTIIAGMEIGRSDRSDPTDEHDEVPLPLHDSSVAAFVDEFDLLVDSWGEWDPAKPAWNMAWWMRISGGAWTQRIKRQRQQKQIVFALLRVILLDPHAWRDHGGWHGSLDNEFVRAKLRRCGVTNSYSILAAYVAELRASGEIEIPTRNRPSRVRR